MKTIKLLASLFITLLLVTSCVEEEIQQPLGDYEHGFFVLNEGGFTHGNSSVTYVSDDYATIEQDVFNTVNARALGDVAQSLYTYQDKMYIIVNNSNKIEVVNRYTMESIKTIDSNEINNPRYMIEYNGKGYVSNWGVPDDASDDTILVIDLTSDSVISTISVGFVPNRMVLVENKLYVELQGHWSTGNENKVEVIDLTNDTIINTIEVGLYPHGMVAYNNHVYVLSNESIVEINTSLDNISKTLAINDGEYLSNLINNDGDIYYSLNNNIYKWNIASNTLPSTHEIEVGETIYGLQAKNGLLYSTNAASDYVSEGNLMIFDLTDNSTIETIATGINPNGVVFN